MPQQEGTAQIQKIILLGGRVCGQCEVVLDNLAKKGLVAEKRLIDYDNPIHQELRDEAVKRGDTSAPIICLEDEAGNLTFFGAGVAFLHVLRLAAREKDFQEARQKELVNV